jgi:hypothetical protein
MTDPDPFDDDHPDDFDPATLDDRFQLAGVRLVEIMLGGHPLTGEAS